VEICNQKNFTKTAKKLHVTQPTMTNAIKELEKEFSVCLIERNTKQFELTDAGRELFDMSLKFLNYAEQIKMVMQDKADEKDRLLLGTPFMTHATFFPHFFHLLHKRYPDIEIKTTHGLTSELLVLLQQGKIHIALVPYKIEDSKFRTVFWKKSRFLFCVSKKHPLAKKKKLRFLDICHEPIISYIGDNYLQKFHIMQKYVECGTEMNIVYRSGQINIMQELIRENEGCGFLIEGSFKDDEIIGFSLDFDMPVYSYLVWTKDTERYSVMHKMLSFIQENSKTKDI